MKISKLILLGFGNVGRAFLNIVGEKRELCRNRYGLDLNFHSIVDIKFNSVLKSKGAFVFPGSLDAKEILEIVSLKSPERVNPYWKPEIGLAQILNVEEPGVLIECTPSDGKTGEPGLSHIRRALDGGWNVATANKGALIVDFRGLKELALKNHVHLKISGATAAALPILDVALYSLAGSEILAIEGILNGTTNYILTRMRKGLAYDAALKEAQDKGIAETDPAKDVEGWDTAYKILLITNAVFDRAYSLNDVKVEGITAIPSKLMKEGSEKGRALKLLGKVIREGEKFILEVSLKVLDNSHQLFGVDGTEKGISFLTDTMASVTVTGGKSDPRGAAAALLKDIINIYRSD